MSNVVRLGTPDTCDKRLNEVAYWSQQSSSAVKQQAAEMVQMISMINAGTVQGGIHTLESIAKE